MYCNFNIFNIYCKRFTDLFRIILKIIYLRQNFTGAIFPGWNEVTERGHQKHRLLSYILITDDFRIYSTRKALRTSCWTHSIFIFFAELTLNHQYVRIGFDSPFSDKFRSQRPGTIWKSFKERSCACLKTFFYFPGASTQNFEKQSILFSTAGTGATRPVVFIVLTFAAQRFIWKILFLHYIFIITGFE